MRPVLANLGFLLQFTGLLLLLPIAVAYFYSEVNSIIVLLTAATAFFALGFLLNALCERKELDFKSSCILITIVFFLLGLIGSIPYYQVFSGPPHLQITNSYFEAISGYTTTGLTLIENVDSLPKSVIFYRGLTQWIGGLGIVFILLVFFYPSKSVLQYGKAVGVEDLAKDMKKSFISILLIYTFYTILFSAIFYFFIHRDVVDATSMTFSGISTGGFAPASDISKFVAFPGNLIISLEMLFGSISYWVHYRFFKVSFKNSITKSKVNLKDFITKELIIFLLMIFFATIVVCYVLNLDIFTSFFHVTSASSTTGFSYIDMAKLDIPIKLGLVFLMLVGGCGFSTAGGIKILRLILFLKAIPWGIKRLLTGNEEKLSFENKALSDTDVIIHFLIVLLAISSVLISAFIFSLYGFKFTDSLFETTSALATTGLSTGLTNLATPLLLKWILTFLMILGRIEIIPFLVTLSPYIERLNRFVLKVIYQNHSS